MNAWLARTLLLALLLPVCAAAEEVPAPPPADAPRITTAFTGADLLEALHRVFVGTELRYEAPKNVPGPFALNVSDVPLDKALKMLLSPQGLLFQREGDLYRITRQEGFQSVGDRLERERQEHLRRYWAELSQRPPKRRARSNVRFLNPPGNDIVGSSRFSSQRLGAPLSMLPTQMAPVGRTLNLGPLQIPLPEAVRMLPGGGVELYFPSEGEYSTGGSAGDLRYPYLGSGGLTFRIR